MWGWGRELRNWVEEGCWSGHGVGGRGGGLQGFSKAAQTLLQSSAPEGGSVGQLPGQVVIATAVARMKMGGGC